MGMVLGFPAFLPRSLRSGGERGVGRGVYSVSGQPSQGLIPAPPRPPQLRQGQDSTPLPCARKL